MNKEKSIEQVKDGVNNYYLEVFSFSKRWIKRQRKEWTSEDIIDAYNQSNYPKPKEYRVFGAVVREFLKLNLIKHYGYSNYRKPSGHAKIVNVWKTR